MPNIRPFNIFLGLYEKFSIHEEISRADNNLGEKSRLSLFHFIVLKQNIECSGKTVEKNIQEIDAEVMMEREVQNGGCKNRSQKLFGNKLSHPRLTVAFPVSWIQWAMIKNK